MHLPKETLAISSKVMKLSRFLSQLNIIDDIEMLANISKMNAKVINQLVERNRVDKLCSLITNLNLENFRLQNRTMRKNIALNESIEAAFVLSRKLSEISIKGQDGEYID